jgi:NAD+ kinase
MQTPFKTIGIIGKPSDPGIAETLTGLYDYLTQHQYTVYVAEDSVKFIKNHAVP